MLTINFNPFPVVSTNRLILRQVMQEDVNEIFFLRSDKRVLTHLAKAPAASTEEASLFIKKINELEKNNDAITWGITLRGEEKLIGTICYWNITKEHYRAEMGYVLHPDFQGKGIMQEAISEVIKYGFTTMKLHSIEARVDPQNVSSIKLLERNHFLREGFFKEDYFYNGKFLDTAAYSLISGNQ
ncbi:MAG: family N-acetyltransferase [Chitinophagaceae bacterium]|nr:family N-acetyltransferase [Chitinophagaceae bacterium]